MRLLCGLDESFVRRLLRAVLVLRGVRELIEIRNYTILSLGLLTLLLRRVDVVFGFLMACIGLLLCVEVGFVLLQECFELIVATCLFQDPIKLTVIVVAILRHHGLEQTPQVVVVWLLLELKVAAVLQVLHELLRDPCRQLLDGGLALFVPDFVVLLVLVLSLETLPRQLTLQEVKKDVADRLEVVTTGLLNANVRVDRGVARRASQRLVVPIRDVLPCLGVSVALRETEVNHVDHTGFGVDAHQKIVRLHISVQEVLRVHEFDASNHLLGEHADRFEREAAVAELKEVLDRGAQQLHDHRLVVALDAVPVDVRDSTYWREGFSVVVVWTYCLPSRSDRACFHIPTEGTGS